MLEYSEAMKIVQQANLASDQVQSIVQEITRKVPDIISHLSLLGDDLDDLVQIIMHVPGMSESLIHLCGLIHLV